MSMIKKVFLGPTLIPHRFTGSLGFTLQLSHIHLPPHIVHHYPLAAIPTQKIAKAPGQVYSIRVFLYFAFLCPLGLLLMTSFKIFGDKISGPSTCQSHRQRGSCDGTRTTHVWDPWVLWAFKMHIYDSNQTSFRFGNVQRNQVLSETILWSYQLQQSTSFQLGQ